MSSSNLALRLSLKLRVVGYFAVDILAAPARWNARRIAAKREHEIALATISANAQADAFKAIGETLIAVVDRTARSHEAQSAVLQTWLEGFKVTQPTSTSAMTDKDEYDLEMQQELAKAGVDVASPSAVMQWLDQQALDAIQ